MAKAPIFEAHRSSDRARMLFHSSSYTANPIACAAANANLAIWRKEPVQARIDRLAARQQGALAAIASHPEVRAPRRLGTIAAFEITQPQGGYLSTIAPALMQFARERNVLLRPLGNTVYVMPPYCIDGADLDAVYAVAQAFLEGLQSGI